MANPKGNPQNLKPRWKKGESGNPQGGRLHDPRYRQLKRLTQDQISELLHWVGNCTAKEMQEIVKDPEAPALKLLVASCYNEAVKSGDTLGMERLLTRMVGPPPQVVEMRNPEGESFRTQALTKEEAEAELARIRAARAVREATK